MAYSALEDIKKLIPEETVIRLTDDEATEAVNQSRVDEAIAQADAEIDSYCGGRYAVPFVSPPAIVKKLSVDIAIYNLYSRTTDKVPETRAERYKSATRLLEQVSKGIVSLGVSPSDVTAPEAAGAETNKETDGNIFSREKMEGF